jgi:TIR domain
MSIAGAKVFLSYKCGHAASEELLHKAEAQLIERGYQVLLDEDLQGGDRCPPRLYEWLLACAAAVVFASPEARESESCQREWHVLAARAETGGARVVPVFVGLQRRELGPLGNFQSIESSPDAVELVMLALAGVEP